MRLKLTIYHSLTASIAAYVIYFHDALNFLLTHETTNVALLISAIYIVVSAYVFVFAADSNWKAVQFQASLFPVLGILGTIGGLAVIGFEANGDQLVLAKMLVEHIGALFIPTGFGVGAVFLLGQQLGLCAGEYGG